MKIINLQAENIKKLQAIDITPKDSVITITGKNGAGKSSILDCITMALCGGKEIPQEPLRKGEEKGKIVLDLGDYQITRSFTADNTYLKIEALDGEKIGSPQKFLDKIVGEVSFDPLEFMNHPAKEQRKRLLALLKIDVEGLDQEEAELREQRTIVGRDRDKAEAAWKAQAFHPEITETEELSPEEILAKMRDMEEHNRKHAEDTAANEDIKNRAIELSNQIKVWQDEVMELRKKIADGEETIAQAKETYKLTKTRLAETEVYDMTDISNQIQLLTVKNTKIRENIAYHEKKQAFKDTQEDYDSYTKRIDDINRKRKDLLATTEMPIAELTFDEGGLLYKGIPLAQCSDGEKLMVSLSISMALNPTLKVLRVKDGSLLDDDNRAIISELVKDKGYQLWYETVGNSSTVGIYIEEGEIKTVDGAPVVKRDPPKPPKRSSRKTEKGQEKDTGTQQQESLPAPGPVAPWETDGAGETKDQVKPAAPETTGGYVAGTDDDW